MDWLYAMRMSRETIERPEGPPGAPLWQEASEEVSKATEGRKHRLRDRNIVPDLDLGRHCLEDNWGE
jgi:hypothetical protein